MSMTSGAVYELQQPKISIRKKEGQRPWTRLASSGYPSVLSLEDATVDQTKETNIGKTIHTSRKESFLSSALIPLSRDRLSDLPVVCGGCPVVFVCRKDSARM